MPLLLALLIGFSVSLAASLVTARPLTRAGAGARLLDGNRHWHAGHIPRFGGIAVFVGLVAGIVAARFSIGSTIEPGPTLIEIAIMLVASAILFTTGLLDDLRGVPPLAKLAAQGVAALIVYQGGLRVDALNFLPGHVIHLGYLSLPITVIWLVGVSNAFNLIDGLDGLAGGVALIALIAVTSTAGMLGHSGIALFTVALAGALLGFLHYNRPPASLFLGDSGSLVVGFLLAVLTIEGATSKGGVLYALIPVLALAYPLFDTGVAILRRWLRRDPLSRADRRHVHHQLCGLGLTSVQSLGLICAGAAGIALLGVVIPFAPLGIVLAVIALASAALVFLFAFGLSWLEYHEFNAAASSFSLAFRNVRSLIQDTINARDISRVISHAASLVELNAILEDNAIVFHFAHMQLRDAMAPDAFERRLAREREIRTFWRLEYPLPQANVPGAVFLTIWCPTSVTQRPTAGERVAHILAPAIADALARIQSSRPEPIDAPRNETRAARLSRV